MSGQELYHRTLAAQQDVTRPHCMVDLINLAALDAGFEFYRDVREFLMGLWRCGVSVDLLALRLGKAPGGEEEIEVLIPGKVRILDNGERLMSRKHVSKAVQP